MAKVYKLMFCMTILLVSQACYIKHRPNMHFLDRAAIGQEAEVMSMKVPMFLVRPFLAKELQEEEDEMLSLAMKKIKSVKLMTLSNAKDNTQIRKDFRSFLKDKRMEEYASIISDGDRVVVSGLMKKDKVKKLMVGISSDDGEHVFIEIRGAFSMEEVGHAISSYEHK